MLYVGTYREERRSFNGRCAKLSAGLFPILRLVSSPIEIETSGRKEGHLRSRREEPVEEDRQARGEGEQRCFQFVLAFFVFFDEAGEVILLLYFSYFSVAGNS